MKKSLIIIAGIAIVAGGAWYQIATSRVVGHPLIVKMSPTELTDRSDLIVVGTFRKKLGQTVEHDSAAGKIVLSRWSVTPIEVWKGSAPSDLVVTTMGGRSGLTTYADDKVNPKAGDSALMYLQHVSEKDAWVLVSTGQGYLTLQNGKYASAMNESFDPADLKASSKGQASETQ